MCFFWRFKDFMSLRDFLNIVFFLLRYKVYLSAIACPLMWETSLNNKTPSLDLLVLFCENESNPPLNQTLPLKKSLAFFLKLFQNTRITKRSKLDSSIFHLICFQLYAWKCVIPISSPNIFRCNDSSYLLNINFFPCP